MSNGEHNTGVSRNGAEYSSDQNSLVCGLTLSPALQQLHWICCWGLGRIDLIAWDLERELKRNDPIARNHFVDEVSKLARECRRGLELIEKASCSDSIVINISTSLTIACSDLERFFSAEYISIQSSLNAVGADFVNIYNELARNMLNEFFRCKNEIEGLPSWPAKTNLYLRACAHTNE